MHALYHQAAEIQSTSWKTEVKVNGTVLDTVFGGHHDKADAYVWVDGGAVTLATGNTTIALDNSDYKDWARVDGVWLTSTSDSPDGKTPYGASGDCNRRKHRLCGNADLR